MNKYGAQAMRHWKTHAPERFQSLDDPARFFTELGQQAQGQITELARQIEANRPLLLAKTSSSRETYLKDMAHRMTALRIAEEVVMQQLAWVSDPSLPLDEAEVPASAALRAVSSVSVRATSAGCSLPSRCCASQSRENRSRPVLLGAGRAR